MRSVHHKLICSTALALLSRTTALAQAKLDCAQPSDGTKEAAYLCAKQHAEYLYWRVCMDRDPCTAADSGVISAFARASTLLDQGWQTSPTAEAAFTHAFLEERAHFFSAAISHYGTCLSIGNRSSGIGRLCATRLHRLDCAVRPSDPGCEAPQTSSQLQAPQQQQPQKHTIVVKEEGGGFTAKIGNSDEIASKQREKPIGVDVVPPAVADVLSSALALSPAEKEQIRSRLKVDDSTTSPSTAKPAKKGSDPI